VFEESENYLEKNTKILTGLKSIATVEQSKAIDYFVGFTEMTRSLLGRAVVFKNDSDTALSSIRCTSCKKKYWVNCGDLSDCTAYEPDCYRCPHCGKVDFITDKIMQEISEATEELAEDGFKTPNEAAGLND